MRHNAELLRATDPSVHRQVFPLLFCTKDPEPPRPPQHGEDRFQLGSGAEGAGQRGSGRREGELLPLPGSIYSAAAGLHRPPAASQEPTCNPCICICSPRIILCSDAVYDISHACVDTCGGSPPCTWWQRDRPSPGQLLRSAGHQD